MHLKTVKYGINRGVVQQSTPVFILVLNLSEHEYVNMLVYHLRV